MDTKASVIIPNYNGRDLLLKNLPAVIKNSTGCEIIVVDDASYDDSVELLRKKFKKIKVIKKSKNEGFARAANLGAQKAKGNYIVLLNTDVSPRKDYLKIALKHFKIKDIFAVGFCDYSHEQGKITLKGRGGAEFKKGFVYHFGAMIDRGETFWVSGGSGIFNREKFLQLSGFDSNFKPFYWEDIDLGFRAWQKGMKCDFEPLAKVDHYHEEGIIKKNHTDLYIKTVSYKNQFIFVWKNVQDYSLIVSHLLWLPYHVIRSGFTFDLPFFFGFTWAFFSLPALIAQKSEHYSQSEREIFEKFKK